MVIRIDTHVCPNCDKTEHRSDESEPQCSECAGTLYWNQDYLELIAQLSRLSCVLETNGHQETILAAIQELDERECWSLGSIKKVAHRIPNCS